MDHTDPYTDKKFSQTSRVDLIVKPNGELWLFHDKKSEDLIAWAEFDEEEQSLSLIKEDGVAQDLGMSIPPLMATYLRNSKTLHLSYIENNKVKEEIEIPITIRSL
jgi:hypothetical protein